MSQDLMFGLQENQCTVFLKKHAEKAISILENKEFIASLVSQIEQNYIEILMRNPNTYIFEIGFQMPFSLLFSYQKKLQDGIDRYIEAIKALTQQYGVSYIDGVEVESTTLGTGQNKITTSRKDYTSFRQIH